MRVLIVSCLGLLWLGRIPAQIELPEFMNPEDPAKVGEMVGPPAPGDRRHADGERESAAEAPSDGVDQQLLDRMRARNVQIDFDPFRTGGGEVDVEVKDLYIGGPRRVELRLRTDRGAVNGPEVLNQTFGVRNSLGEFPVRLHVLERVEALEPPGTYRFSFRSGDVLEGTPTLESITLYLLDGRTRIVRMEEVRSLEVVAADPSPPVTP